MMRVACAASFSDPLSLILARRIAAAMGPDAPRWCEPLAVCAALRRLRYVREWPEIIVDLRTLVSLRAGDCDDMAVASAALLARLGWPSLWAIGWRDGSASHVWTAVPVCVGRSYEKKTWCVLDVDPTYRGRCGSTDREQFSSVTLHKVKP